MVNETTSTGTSASIFHYIHRGNGLVEPDARLSFVDQGRLMATLIASQAWWRTLVYVDWPFRRAITVSHRISSIFIYAHIYIELELVEFLEHTHECWLEPDLAMGDPPVEDMRFCFGPPAR